MADRTAPHVLLYDGECVICSWMARWVRRMDWRGRVTVRPRQDSDALLGDPRALPPFEAMLLIDPDGTIASGGDALPALAASLWSGPELARLLRASPAAVSAMKRLYSVLVELRGRLTCHVSSGSS